MAEQERTLKELSSPDVNYQALCLEFPTVETIAFELKPGLINLLPKFPGLAGEDPHKHLLEFHIVCTNMKPQGVTEEAIKLRAFSFSMQNAAKDWLYSLSPTSVTCWNDLKRAFLEKFFPASLTASIRKDICGIGQITGETLYEYWEQFKKLCGSCPHHHISDQLLIQYFYEGLLPMDRNMIDSASGGALFNKTPAAARNLIETVAANSQQFGTRAISQTKAVNEICIAGTTDSLITNKLDDLQSMIRQIALNQNQCAPVPTPQRTAIVCGICTSPEHPTDACPTLREDEQQAVVNGVFTGGQQYRQQKYDPFS
ncbi:uncharacterized protein LOC130744434 [Lotus japonicus]|uniref:uncharacterized protein LOC130744434 n=1 Tax=Lotus japonicus TaxID=34305 RepID=UPI00259040D8|nr:uncharacterized protein LOC130744434 [Lotus japonicus]